MGVREERSQGQDWEGETVCGRWNGWKLSAGFGIGRVELSGEDGMVGWLGIWRAELFREGGMVGGLIKTAGGIWQNHSPATE